MINGTCKHFVLSAGYGSGGGGSGGYNRGGNDHQSSSGGDDSRMETQHDTIFIQNLPRTASVDDLKDVFSQIGVIKVKYGYFVCDIFDFVF
jgi:RNA recognition motif-containing protein